MLPAASDGTLNIALTTHDQMGLGVGDIYRLLGDGVYDVAMTVGDYAVADAPELEGLDVPLLALDAARAQAMVEAAKPMVEDIFNARFQLLLQFVYLHFLVMQHALELTDVEFRLYLCAHTFDISPCSAEKITCFSGSTRQTLRPDYDQSKHKNKQYFPETNVEHDLCIHEKYANCYAAKPYPWFVSSW